MAMYPWGFLYPLLLIRTHKPVSPFQHANPGANCGPDCVGVFQAYYENVTLREYAPSTIAWISSLMIFFMFFFGPIIGEC